MISVATLIQFVVQLIVISLIFGLIWWLIEYTNPPEPFKKVLTVVVAVVAVLILIGFLMSLAGMPIVHW